MIKAYYNEIDPKAAAWLRELIKQGHIAQGEVDERSIIDVRSEDLRGFTQCHFFAGIGVWSYALRKAGWADDRPVWTGSCPCQPFSAAGKGDEFADERHLWPAWFRLIQECRPVAIFGEQVASKDALSWLDHVSTDLEGEDYTIGSVSTVSCGFGAPHIRQRLYFVAHSSTSGHTRGESRGGTGKERESGRPVADSGIVGDLADTNGQRLDRLTPSGIHERWNGEEGNEQEKGSADGSCGGDSDRCGELVAIARLGTGDDRRTRIEFMGDTSSGGFGIQRDAAQSRSSGHADGTEQSDIMVNSDSPRCQGNGLQPIHRGREECGEEQRIARSGAAQCLDNPIGNGRGEVWNDNRGNVGFIPDSTVKPGATNGFWANAEWIPCRDGKARPVEPGTFPLAHGSPARVGRLRGYGNAINAEQANEQFRAARRAKMPQCCEIEKAFKDVFGVTVEVLYASENGIVVGRPGEKGVVPSVHILQNEKKKAHETRSAKRRKP